MNELNCKKQIIKPYFGFLNINKPKGLSSHDIVNSVRRFFKTKQVGHAGTLDPLASGVLPIALGGACRLLRFLEDDKIYLAEILFGKQTDTDDITGKVIKEKQVQLNFADVQEKLKFFQGEIKQKPPLFSAIHVKGKRLYELARSGQAPDIETIAFRQVTIHNIETIDFTNKLVNNELSYLLKIRIHCSTGTYIRSIARDLGEALDSPACLYSLQRERVGRFDLNNSISLDSLESLVKENQFEIISKEIMQDAKEMIKLNKIELENDELTTRLSHGQTIKVEISPSTCLSKISEQQEILVTYKNNILAVCQASVTCQEADALEIQLKPNVVFPNLVRNFESRNI